MNKRLLILFLLFAKFAPAQFYLRGELRDERNNLLPNARIILHSTGYVYSSGSSGLFGILMQNKTDSVTISLSGYQPVASIVDAGTFQSFILRQVHTAANVQHNKLSSFTRNLQFDQKQHWLAAGESYSSLVENDFVEAKKYPETGFAIRIDKASYSNVRRFLNMESKVPPDAVRIEELLNYFNFGYTPPSGDSLFTVHSVVSQCPWNDHNRLLFLKLGAKKLSPEDIPPSNLVFLIDVSGSMDLPNRLPLLKSAFKLLIDNLREQDTISIVVYGGSSGVWLTPTSGNDKIKIRKAIEDLYPSGSTPGESGIISAYRIAKSQFIEGGNNRVILATDGDFNVGQSTDEQLEKLIATHKESGIYLTCLGVGMGNYKDSKLEVLAKKGNGNFAYLDSELEAEKVLVKEFTQTLYSIADDAFLMINFDSRFIRRYRLIGYDNKLKALTDTISEIEGGEVGSGHSMLAIFEMTPSDFMLSSTYQKNTALAKATLHFKNPLDSARTSFNIDIPDNYIEFSALDSCYRFATSVAMFGSLLKESDATKTVNWSDTHAIAAGAYASDDPAQKQFLEILEKARKIYSRKKRKR